MSHRVIGYRVAGEKVRELRSYTTTTQEDLASDLGVSSRTVSMWENDHKIPRGSNSDKLVEWAEERFLGALLRPVDRYLFTRIYEKIEAQEREKSPKRRGPKKIVEIYRS